MHDSPFSFLFLALSGDSSDEDEEEDDGDDEGGGGGDEFSRVQFGSRYQRNGVSPCMCIGTNFCQASPGDCFASEQDRVR